jgi:hypothetical protein
MRKRKEEVFQNVLELSICFFVINPSINAKRIDNFRRNQKRGRRVVPTPLTTPKPP